MVSHRHIHVNGGSRTSQEHHCQPGATKQYAAHLETRLYQERLDSRFFGYGPEFRREGGDYLTLKHALHHILPQAVYRTWETSISRQQDEHLPYMGTARIALIVGVSIRKIQMDFQYMEQRGLLRRIPAMRNGYYVHLLDYHGLYQLAHEYIEFKDSTWGNIPANPEFIALAPPQVQALLIRVARYAAAVTHKKRGRKPCSIWTPQHATLKSPLHNAIMTSNDEADFYENEDEVAQHPASHTPGHEADEHQAQVKTAPLPDSNQQSHSLYMAKENLQKNLQKISPYESESYDSNIISVSDSNPLSLKNFFEDDSDHSQRQPSDQSSIIQFPSENLPAKQISRQATSISKQTMIRQGTEQTRIQQETRQALNRQSTSQATQRWPRLHHSIEYFLADISSEFGDQAPKSSISQVRRIYFEQLHPHCISMSQFYELIVFFKAEALYAVISKTNPNGQINRMPWFLAAIRNHVQRALQSGAQGAPIIDALLTFVPAASHKAAAQPAQEPHHRAVDWHHTPTSQAPLPQSHDDTLDVLEPVDETDAPLMMSSREVRAIDPRRLRVQQALTQIRPLVKASLLVRYDNPCRHCHNVVFALVQGGLRCVLCQPAKEWQYGKAERIASIIKSIDEPPGENKANQASGERWE